MHSASTLTFLDGLSEEEWVLHGSPNSCDYLWPSDPEQGHLIPEYNHKAVYGTCLVDIAVLYATIRTPSEDWGWRFIDDLYHPHILIVGPERLRVSQGYIHLVKRSAFIDFVLEGLTCLAYKEVKSEQEFIVYPSILELLIRQRRIVVMSYEEYARNQR